MRVRITTLGLVLSGLLTLALLCALLWLVLGGRVAPLTADQRAATATAVWQRIDDGLK